MKPILLDIMLDDRFLCQMDYTAPAKPLFIEGKPMNVYNLDDIKSFVYSKRPSLKGKNIRISFSNQKILTL